MALRLVGRPSHLLSVRNVRWKRNSFPAKLCDLAYCALEAMTVACD
jgi:hypothetical protein